MQINDKVLIACKINNPDIKDLEDQYGKIKAIVPSIHDNVTEDLFTISFDDPDIEKIDEAWGKTLFELKNLKSVFLVHYSKYSDGHDIQFLQYNELSLENISSAFKELECNGYIVTKLIGNSYTINCIKEKLGSCIINNYFWTAELQENNELSNNDIIITSDN